MKKIIICLFTIISLFSCNNDPKNSASIIRESNNNMEVELVYNNELGSSSIGKKSQPPFNRIYKFKFEGHKYIYFDGYRRCGVVHNPNCECFNK